MRALADKKEHVVCHFLLTNHVLLIDNILYHKCMLFIYLLTYLFPFC
jgi:hypothetical protein